MTAEPAGPSYEGLSHEALAALVPEYLLAGHLIDRAGMPHLIAAFGLEGMRDVAIAEWMGASPIYSRRMQEALGFTGDSVETIFKGMQIDVGAPPQFLDFRFVVHDHDHGEFWLDHCGALADVEPMGNEFVVAMCHDIEDPTFDATASATNPRAQVRPVHRPPRLPADRGPVCAWTVTIAEDHPPVAEASETTAMAATQAATLALAGIDPSDPGRHHYADALQADLDLTAFSSSALRRIADEVCLQGHLLALSYRAAVAVRTERPEDAVGFLAHQFTGVAGVAAERLRDAFDLPSDASGVARLLALHPAFRPHAYVGASVEIDERVRVRIPKDSAAMADGAWPSVLTPTTLHPIDAMVRALDDRYTCQVTQDDADALVVEVVLGSESHPTASDVRLTQFSTGATFAFTERRTPVTLRPTRP